MSAFLTAVLYRTNIVFSDDLSFHFGRFKSVLDALHDGQIVPQLAPNAVHGFGYAIGLNYPPLGAYIFDLIYFLLRDQVLTHLAFTFLAFLLAGLFMFYFVREIASKVEGQYVIALVSALFFMLSPYFFVCVVRRFAVGEFYAMIFAPLLLLGLYKILNGKNGVAALTIGASGILLSHTLSIAMWGAIAVLILLLNAKYLKKLRPWKQIFLSGLITFALTAFYTLPFLETTFSKIYMVSDTYFRTNDKQMNPSNMNGYASSFINLFHFDGTFQSPYDSQSVPRLGYIFAIILLLALFFLKNLPPKLKPFTYLLTFLSVFSIILTTNLVNWKLLPNTFSVFQFAYRFSSIFTVCLSAISGIILYHFVYSRLKRNCRSEHRGRAFFVILAVILVVQATPILYQYDHISVDKDLSRVAASVDLNSPTLADFSTAEGDVFPQRFHAVSPDNSVKQFAEKYPSVNGLKLNDYTKDGSHFSASLSLPEGGKLVLPQFYYPGYQAVGVQNATQADLEVTQSDDGMVQISLPAGFSGQVESHFGMSKATAVGFYISLLSVLLLLGYGVYLVIKKRR
ncbi:MAG: hypothetical protein LBQ41_00740 [Candidatus Ancillula sp.]|jgi:hypothetical protein|nr:hypothetical protein [Candidatus Ancillula sp.]